MTATPTDNVLMQLSSREATVLHKLVDQYVTRANDDDVKNRHVWYIGVSSSTLIHLLDGQVPKTAVKKSLTRLHDLGLIYLNGDSMIGFAWKPLPVAKQAFGLA